MQAWETFLDVLEKEMGAETIAKWLRPLQIVHFDACNLYLEAHDSFQLEWFEEYIRPRIKTGLLNNNFHPIKVHLSQTALSSHSPQKTSKKNAPPPTRPFKLATDSLQPELTLESFIVTPVNQIVFQLLTRILDEQKPNSMLGQFNPIYLHGSSSTGKTHLLQAMATELKQRGKQVIYIRTETFTENVVNAIRNSNMQEFRKAHRHVDVLLLDDIHQFAKKNATQEEFFHTFNSLHIQAKQMILSANTPPSLLQEIEPRLVSRFEWGIVLSLGKLEGEDLLKMLKQRCEALHFKPPHAVLQFLLETFSHNIKSLHKSLEALVLRCHQSAKEIKPSSLTPSSAKEMLKDLIEEEKKQVLNPQKIVSVVSAFYALTPQEILGKSQTHDCTLARQLCMYLCRQELKMAFTKIGDFFDRDHSTVITSVRSIEEKLLSQDKELSSSLLSIARSLENSP